MSVNRFIAMLAVAALSAACGGESPRSPARSAATTAAAPLPAPTPAAQAASDRASIDSAAADSASATAPRRPPLFRHMSTPDPVRGLYVSRLAARGDAVWDLIALARRTSVNALVFDVKDDDGQLLYPSTVGLAHVIGADTAQPMPVRRLHAMMDSLRKYHLYAIARIAVARDPVLAAHRPQWAVPRRADDPERNAWLDPRHREVWAYAADLASEAAGRGFSEVQFADVRFPDSRNQAELLELSSTDGRTRSQVIRDQLGFLGSRMSSLDVPMAIAVDGRAALDSSDLDTGQRWEMLVDRADVVMPMFVPPRYPAGDGVGAALAAAKRRTAAIRGAGQLVPWYADAGAGPASVRSQIEAGYAQGIRSWMLWNSAGRYTPDALRDSTRAPAPKKPAHGAASAPAPRKVSGRAGGRARR